MTKVDSKHRVVALLLVMLTIFSTFANTSLVWGSDSDFDVGSITVYDESVIGRIDGDTGYIKYGEVLTLDCTNCNWEDLVSISVYGTDRVNENKIDSPGLLEVPKVDDVYTIEVCKRVEVISSPDEATEDEATDDEATKDEATIDEPKELSESETVYEVVSLTYSLSEVTSFSEVKYDVSEMIVNSVYFGETELSNGKWVLGSVDNSLVINSTIPNQVLSLDISLNDTDVEYSLDGGTITIKSDIVKDLLNTDNYIKLAVVNMYGTEYTYDIGFKYDSSEIKITDVKTSKDLLYAEDEVIAEKGISVEVEIDSGVSNVSSVEVKNDDEVVSTEASFTIEDEGIYTITVKTESGNSITEKLFKGYTVRFDNDKPVLKDVYFCEDKLADAWYNKNGKLEFVIEDNIALADEAIVSINGKDVEVTATKGDSLKNYTYSVNASEADVNPKGIYNVEISLKDLAGNDFSDSVVLRIDTAKPTYEGISVDSKVEIDNIYYIVDNIVVRGSFYDEASGVKSVSFKADSSDDFEEIQLPYTLNEKGVFKIEDNAGNTQEYTLDTLLNLLGMMSYVVDTDDPHIIRESMVGDYIKDGIDYFSSVPTISYKITDSNMKSVDFYVNGVKQESTYNINDIYNFTPKGVSDGKITVKVVATDKVDKTDENVYEFYLDTKPPLNIIADTDNPTNIKGNNVYFKSDVNVSVKARDTYSGIKNYYLNNEKNENGLFVISEDGSYSVKVEDNLGNLSDSYPLGNTQLWGSNNIVIDTVDPTISANRPEGESSSMPDWYDANVTYTISLADNKGINSAYVEINGVKVDTFDTDKTDVLTTSLSADTSKVKPNNDGSYKIKVYVEDNSKRNNTWSDTIYIDTNAPSDIKASAPTPVNEKGENVYYRSDFDISVTAKDDYAGVDKYILNGKEDKDGKFSINTDGSYSVVVKDKLENSTDAVTLQSLLNWSGNNVVIDGSKPEIFADRPDGESTDKKDWYDKDVIYNIKITDNKGIDSAYVLINDTKVDEFSTNSTSEKTVNLTADTSKVAPNKDGSYSISVHAIDNSKNPNDWSDKIYIDGKPPVNLSVIALSPVNEKGGKVYYNSQFGIQVSAEDDYAGIKGYYLNDDYSANGKFIIPSDGNYSVSALDNLGNNTGLKSLSSILNWKGNDIIIDSSNPKIQTERPDGESTKEKNWYNKNVVYTISVTDDKGIDNVKVFINGKVVDSFNTDAVDATTTTVYADTSKVKANPDGSYNIEVYAEDNCKNPDYWSDTIYIDTNAPTGLKVSAPKPVNEKKGVVYYNNNIDIQVSAEDDYSGVENYYLNSSNNSTGKFTISSDGSYYVLAEDKLGNKSSSVDLSDLLKWSGNKIVIDGDEPNISSFRPDGESSNKSNWYGSDVVYNISVTDNKGIDNAYVTINGTKVDNFSTDLLDVKTVSLKADTSKVNPNDDGSYVINAYAEDNGKLTKYWSDTIYIDKTNPEVVDFLISGDIERKGDTIKGSDSKYGFYFNGNGSVQIKVKDTNNSSGIYSIWTKLDGQDWKQHITNGDTVAYVDIPKDYKGFIKAYAVDKVGHKSDTEMPDGLVSESENTHFNHSKVDITFSDTVKRDNNNLPLYNSDMQGVVYVSCDWSGLKKLEWGIGDDTFGTITDFSGASSWDKNLPLSFSTKMNIGGNSNALTFWVKVTDTTGHTSKNSRQFSIDKDSPVIKVSYDKTNEDKYYNTSRVATITLNERNFDSSKFNFEGKYGSLSGWSRNGDVWTNTINFVSDDDYNFTLSCVDQAGNNSNTYTSGSFTIDKTKPSLSVSWNNNDVRNGKYYNGSRVATVTVNERNFNGSLIDVSNASISGWSNNGDVHTATIVFDKDGEYKFSISGRDLAGNSLNETFDSGDFTIDSSKPSIVIEGVSNGVSYKDDLGIRVSVFDKYFDTENTYVKLYGKNHKEVNIVGYYNGETGLFTFNSFPKDRDTDDLYTLTAVVTDKAGNISEETRKFSVNRFGSDYSFNETDYLGSYLNEAKSVTITELNVDRIDTSKVKIVITLNGRNIDIDSNNIKITEEEKDGKYLYTYYIDKAQFTKDGKYTIQIYSVSDDGTEYTSVAEQYDFVIDTTRPEIIISGVESNNSYQDYSRKVTIDVRDLSDVKSLRVLLNGSEVKAELEGDMYVLSIPESSEYQNLKVEVTDMAGNISTKEVNNFIISSNFWIYIWNQLWFKLLLVAIGIGIILLIVVLVLRKRRDSKEEEKLAKENEKYYRSSGSSSGGTPETEGSSNTDIVDEELEIKQGTNFMEKPEDDSDTNIIE